MVPQTGSGQETVIQQARTLIEQKQPAEAARILRLHLASHPGTATEYKLLGVALSGSGEDLLALQALERAAEMDPENAAAHYNLGLAYKEFGRHREAIAAMERSLQLRPDHPAATRSLAELRQRTTASPGGGGEPWGSPVLIPQTPSPTFSPESGLAEDRSLLSRLLEAAWQLVWSPARALNGGMDTFFNTPGAVGAVIGFFLVSIGLATAGALAAGSHGEGAASSGCFPASSP
jgi:tetratricopeptide (TPR) repeat protein